MPSGGMQRLGPPTLRPVLHHEWTRRFFAHRPDDAALDDHVDEPCVLQGTSLSILDERPDHLERSLLVARNPHPAGSRRRLLIWQGARALRQESFYGLFGRRFQKIAAAAFPLLLERATHFFIRDPESDPSYLLPLAQFGRMGVSVPTLERIVGAPVLVAADGLYARRAYVPSLRVFAGFDGRRYGDSSRKLFYDHAGRPVSVEQLAREVLERFGYRVVPPGVFGRFFFALTGRPASAFAPDAWPTAFLSGRLSPVEPVLRARSALARIRRDGATPCLLAALGALAKRPPYRDHEPPEGGLPLLGRYFARAHLEGFLESVGDERLHGLLTGLLWGHRVVAADWFAYRPGDRRVFACEVKSQGDTLRPYQKESILYGQRRGLLEYRLLEILHQPAPHRGARSDSVTNRADGAEAQPWAADSSPWPIPWA